MFKKLIAATVVATIIFSAISTGLVSSAVYDNAIMYGDIDSNGTVDTEDARLALRAACGTYIVADDETLQKGDIDRDGAIGIYDARQILKAAVGLVALQPTGSFSGFDGGGVFDTDIELIEYFNTALNKIKVAEPEYSYAAGFTKTSTDKLSEFEILKTEFLGVDISASAEKITEEVRDMIVAEDNDNTVLIVSADSSDFDVMSIEKSPYVSKLTVDDIYGASASYNAEKGEVTITLSLPDTNEEDITKSAYAKVFDTDSVLENSSKILKKLISNSVVNSTITCDFKDCVLTAVIDTATGNIVSYTTSYDNSTFVSEAKFSGLSGNSNLFTFKNLTYKKTHTVIYDNFQWGV